MAAKSTSLSQASEIDNSQDILSEMGDQENNQKDTAQSEEEMSKRRFKAIGFGKKLKTSLFFDISQPSMPILSPAS